MTDAEFSRWQAHGAWSISTDDGRKLDGEGLMRLVNGRADDKTVRHGPLHTARGPAIGRRSRT